MLKTIKNKFLTRFVAINKGNITHFTATSKGNAIDILSTNKDRAIKGFENSINKDDDISTINTNNIRFNKVKTAKSKSLV